MTLDYSETDFFNFFNFIGLSFVDAQTYIRNYRTDKSTIAFELDEHSPFEKKPVLIHNGLYIPYSNLLLKSAFKNNIYDFFKKYELDFLSGKGIFGMQFENHIAKGIKYLGCDFMRENAIEKIIGQKKKCADFLIKDNNSMIIIDAKGTELNHISRVNHEPEQLQKHLENQIEKALVQIFSTAYHLNNNDNYNNFTTRYALIVTYKEYAFGSLNDELNNCTKQSLIEKLDRQGLCGSLDLVPFENIFVISIDDFDYLIAGLKANNQNMANVLQKIIDSEKKSKCMLFEQYLNEIFTKDHCPEYLFDIYKQSPFGVKNVD